VTVEILPGDEEGGVQVEGARGKETGEFVLVRLTLISNFFFFIP